jgi:flagellar biosynthesis anti-sigma factor FlgM
MKVQSHAIQAYARTALNPAAPAQPVAEPSPQPHSSDEAAHVTLSAEARELAVHKGGVDHEKVSRLQQKLASGELSVNSQTLALRMLDTFG